MNEDKMENMLSQLIRMVGNIQSDLQEIKQEQQEIKQEQQEMKREQQEMKREQQEMKRVQQEMQSKLQDLALKGEERHQEVLDRFKALEIDQNFVWEKTARNEREIANIKGQLS
jgi:FtsZ-binding cell division protein ZapB